MAAFVRMAAEFGHVHRDTSSLITRSGESRPTISAGSCDRHPAVRPPDAAYNPYVRNEQIDAWMLLAVAYGRNGAARAPMADLIEAADWINHTLPLYDELRRGLNRLIAAGLVDVDDGTFGLTAAGESLFARVRKGAGSRNQSERLEGVLSGLEDPAIPTWMPADDELGAAVQAYHDRAKREINDLLARRR
jgi:hypothetical protein